MNNTVRTNITKTITEVALFSALGFVLDELQGILGKGLFINGGSIGFAMITVIIISFRRGLLPGFFTGLIIGLFDMATGAYIIHPAQPLLDYLLPYALVCTSALLKNKFKSNNSSAVLVLAVVIGGIFKLLSHYLSGILFWNNNSTFAWNLSYMPASLYSLIYNLAFIGPSIVISAILLLIINKSSHRVLVPNNDEEQVIEVNTNNDKRSFILSLCLSIIGAFLFIFFLIKYIKSYKYEQYSSNKFEYYFDKDSMVIFILGFLVLLIGLIQLILIVKKNNKKVPILPMLSLIDLISIIYSVNMLVRSYKKLDYTTNYWIWFSISLFILILFLIFILILYKRKKEK